MPLKFFSARQPQQQLYLGLLVTETSVQAVLWGVQNGRVEVWHQSQAHQYTDPKSAVVAADAGLQELGKESEKLSEVIFGLEPDWVTETGIAEERKSLLKHLTQELSLKAIGFVANNEAWVQYTRDLQGGTSAVCLYVTASEVLVAAVAQGKITAQEKVGRSDDVVVDVVEALARLGGGGGASSPAHLPLKWLLGSLALEDTELVELHQRLTSYDWSQQPQLPQDPSVQMVPQIQLLPAIIHQAGHAVAQAKGLLENPADSPGRNSTLDQPSADEFGFSSVSTKPSTPVAKSFGVPITQTFAEFPESEASGPAEPTSQWQPRVHFGQSKGHNRKKLLLPVLGGLVAGVLALLVIGVIWWQQTAQAVIQLKLKTQRLTQTLDLSLDPSISSSQADQRKVAAQAMAKTVSGETTVPTTGVKEMGEKAKGTVTLVNKTQSSKSFGTGTLLSIGKVQFALDKEVTVPAASVSAQTSEGETKTYGKSEAPVTAVKIGEEGNIKKDSDLKVADFADNTYGAVAKADFAGGISREVKVVAEKDRQSAADALKAKLIAEAEKGLKQELAAGKSLVMTGQTKTVKAEFDQKTGDEAEAVSLKLTLEVQALTYEVAQLRPLALAILTPLLPANFELGGEAPSVLSAPATSTSSSSTVVIKAEVSAPAYPKVNLDQWKQEVAGKKVAEAKQLLASKAEVVAVEIHLLPSILEKIIPWLPRRTDLIQLNRQAN